MTLEIFAACAPGLEPMLCDELRALGVPGVPVAGGVEFQGDLGLVYRANLELGLALKVLVRLGTFKVTRFPELVRHTAQLPWEQWLGRAVRVRAHCRKSRLYHSDGVAQRVRAGIDQRLGSPTDDGSGPEVQVRLQSDRCTLSIDTSGELLHKRGYRLATAKAPLREDLARALVITSGWDRVSPLVDPFCGAGTILIEAAWLAGGVPVGHLREFAFTAAPNFDRRLWESIRRTADSRRTNTIPQISGSDRDAGAIEAARSNAARAGLIKLQLDVATLTQAPAMANPAPVGGLVTNPPFGRRIGSDRTLPNLYRALGARLAELPAAWTVGLLAASRQLVKQTGIDLDSAVMTDHGGGKVFFYTRPNH